MSRNLSAEIKALWVEYELLEEHVNGEPTPEQLSQFTDLLIRIEDLRERRGW